MTSTPVVFTNRSGFGLAGVLDTPLASQPKAYALLAPCFTCGKALKPFVFINRQLTSMGIAVLRFDFTGLGESEGDFTKTDLTTNEHDLLDSAAFLAEKHAPPVMLIGHSMGGIAAIRTARQIESIRAVVTIATPGRANHLASNLKNTRRKAIADGHARVAIGGQDFVLRREFFERLDEVDIKDDLHTLNKPLLILHSPADQTVDIDNAAEIFRHARHPKSFVSLDTADHLMLDRNDARYAGDVIAAWANPYLFSANRT